MTSIQSLADKLESCIKALNDTPEAEEALEFAQGAMDVIGDVEADFDVIKTELDEKKSEVDELEDRLEEYDEGDYFAEIVTPNGSINYQEPENIAMREIMDSLGEKLNKVGHNEIQRILDAI